MLLTQTRALPREQFINILRAAIDVQAWRFSRQASQLWLAQYPGDLPVRLMFAKSLLKSGQMASALSTLKEICAIDPEYKAAVGLRFEAELLISSRPKGDQGAIDANAAWLACLGGQPERVVQKALGVGLPGMSREAGWFRPLQKARRAMEAGDFTSAEKWIQTIVVADDAIPLIASTHLAILYHRMESGDTPLETLRSLAAYYHSRWPDCAQAKLLLAQALMSAGEHERSVALLHEAAGQDITGQVPGRMWGASHPYRDLWPAHFEVHFDIAIPAEVNAVLGWNILPSAPHSEGNQDTGFLDVYDIPPSNGRQEATEYELSVFDLPGIDETELPYPIEDEHSPKTKAAEDVEILKSVRKEMEGIAEAISRPELATSDARFPVYVIMTTRGGLERRYGPQVSEVIEMEMTRLMDAIEDQKDWGAMLFYADEGTCVRDEVTALEGKTRNYTDPWALKLALSDLDEALRENGERIGAVLIVGGPEVVPFHKLPNPVDDADADVPSDNPYATRDENYFVPEWPVGRLPDGDTHNAPNPDYLLGVLGDITAAYNRQPEEAHAKPWFIAIFEWIINKLFKRPITSTGEQTNLGYCAAVWKGASTNAFRPIGGNDTIMLSPPVGTLPPGSKVREGSPLPASQLGYFNLHGLEDSKEWFGQSDPFAGDDGEHVEDYPVAVSPEDILNSARPPSIIFSEACYGANILQKNPQEALCLAFLQAGSRVFVGSTCTAYGSIDMPLIAADFLAYRFWSHLDAGLTAGEAFQLAKVDLAAEMDERQGYLDGEDQKTLISFVLYGDPLASAGVRQTMRKAPMRRVNAESSIPTVCDKAHQPASEQIPEEVLGYVRNVVEQYLPGMSDAEVTWSQEHVVCEGERCSYPMHQRGQNGKNGRKETAANSKPTRQVVTLSKHIQLAHTHHHFARLTLDEGGKLVKLAVSR